MPFVQYDGAARNLPLQGLKIQNANTVAKRQKLKAGILSV